MRVVMVALATASLWLAACNSCGPKDAPVAPKEASEVTPDVAPQEALDAATTSAADTTNAAPATPAAPAAKVHQKGRQIRTAPPKKITMAPVQKCPQGGCEFRCDMMKRCLFTCDGGDCHQICGPDSSCTATCTGGGCVQQCHASAGCTLRCRGGQCDQQCDAKSACSRTCKGGECKVCQGTDCQVKPL